MNDAPQSSNATTASLTTATHFAAIDYLRIVAAFAIICYHTGAPGGNWTSSGLQALTAAAVFFAARSRSKTSDGEIIRKRFERIMIPWFFFSMLHFVLLLLFRPHEFKTWMIWTGASMHLWFLPFVFMVSCLVAIGARRKLFASGYVSATAWAVLGIVMIASEVRFELVDKLLIPIPQFRSALPAALFGLAIYSFPRSAAFPARCAALLFFNLIILAVYIGFRSDDSVPYPCAAIGATVFAVCLAIPLPQSAASCFVGRVAFGVYLVQGLAIWIAFVALAKTPMHSLQTTHPNNYSFIVATTAFLIGLAAVAVLERTPLRRVIA